MTKQKIFIADKISTKGVEGLQGEFDVDFTTGLSEDEVCKHVSGVDAIIVRSTTKITSKILDCADQLKVIGRAGIGVDNIDVVSATERGIVVLNTPDANATTTAELAIAHMLSLSRHLPDADRSVRAGEWKRSAYVGTEIAGKILGVIGYGTIGRIVASRGLGLKMRVLAHDPFVTSSVFEADGVEPEEIDTLLANADFVTLHCPATESTRNLLSRERLASMKPGARVINCARGGLIDEEALYDLLSDGQLAGAALDVYAQEPPNGSPLLTLPNIAFTPHLGASTAEAQEAVGIEIAHQVATYLNNGEPINAINLAGVSADELSRSRPYQQLACRLARLLVLLSPGALQQVEVAVQGRAAELDPHPVAVEALVGLLSEHHSTPVNQVNALHIAKRQGITLVESRSAETYDYMSLVTITGRHENGVVSISGTLFDERHPRLVRINSFDIEAHLEGHLLITLHDDKPGVIGSLGAILGQANINITRMQVGIADNGNEAIAMLEVSEPLSDALVHEVYALDPIRQTIQISL